VPRGTSYMMRLAATDPAPSFDPDLIARVRRGDPAALTAIYQAFGGELMALARRVTGSHADAEDVLHDLIVGLPDAMRGYDERGKLRAWLKRVVVRMCLMRMRAARRRHETDFDAAGPIAASTVPANDIGDAIEIALRGLAPTIRVVVVLRFFDGLSHREIAETLGISVNASEARLSRAIAALRLRLETLI
jgi:RNA polymerase sigma-70 factor, ECF subfamily